MLNKLGRRTIWPPWQVLSGKALTSETSEQVNGLIRSPYTDLWLWKELFSESIHLKNKPLAFWWVQNWQAMSGKAVASTEQVNGLIRSPYAALWLWKKLPSECVLIWETKSYKVPITCRFDSYKYIYIFICYLNSPLKSFSLRGIFKPDVCHYSLSWTGLWLVTGGQNKPTFQRLCWPQAWKI